MQSGDIGIAVEPLRQRGSHTVHIPVLHAVLSFTRAKPLAAAGGVIIVVMVICAVFAPIIAPQDPARINTREAFLEPSTAHWFGTDNYGRDMFARIVYG